MFIVDNRGLCDTGARLEYHICVRLSSCAPRDRIRRAVKWPQSLFTIWVNMCMCVVCVYISIYGCKQMSTRKTESVPDMRASETKRIIKSSLTRSYCAHLWRCVKLCVYVFAWPRSSSSTNVQIRRACLHKHVPVEESKWARSHDASEINFWFTVSKVHHVFVLLCMIS